MIVACAATVGWSITTFIVGGLVVFIAFVRGWL